MDTIFLFKKKGNGCHGKLAMEVVRLVNVMKKMAANLKSKRKKNGYTRDLGKGYFVSSLAWCFNMIWH